VGGKYLRGGEAGGMWGVGRERVERWTREYSWGDSAVEGHGAGKADGGGLGSGTLGEGFVKGPVRGDGR